MDIDSITGIPWEDLCIGDTYYCCDDSIVFSGCEPEPYPYLVEVVDNGKDIEGNEYIFVERLKIEKRKASGFFIFLDDYQRRYKFRYST